MLSLEYLQELRGRLLHSVILVTVVFGVFSVFAKDLYTMLAAPLLHFLPQGEGFIATQVASTFIIPFKFAFVAAVFVSVPYLLWQLWQFIAPALYIKERQLLWRLIIIGSLLFYMGVAFAYFVVFPLMFRFFVSVTPAGVALRPDITQYLDFVLAIFMAFGVVFEVPIITWGLVRLGLVSRGQLQAYRPYVILSAFILGMLLTPPDVVSQILLALPMWGLFELGLLFSRDKKQNR